MNSIGSSNWRIDDKSSMQTRENNLKQDKENEMIQKEWGAMLTSNSRYRFKNIKAIMKMPTNFINRNLRY